MLDLSPKADFDLEKDLWQQAFIEGQEVLDAVKSGNCPARREEEVFRNLSRMVLSENPDILRLIWQYMGLEDLLDIHRRMIGSGLIGGKTVGMLLGRRILENHSQRFSTLLEPNDSFYVGSDVFLSFLSSNGVSWSRESQRSPETLLESAEIARRRILEGKFPDQMVQQFQLMLDHFGQSPIIVRSSSLLEDNFGNSFAGKYESVFCPNQGSPERRLEDFLSAARIVYASSMSEKALRYKEQKGILDQEEQMALLVMRVSGAVHGRYFYPHAAGVAFSHNPYVWNENIDPLAGVVRLVFGLGTRAVNRSDDDYTRVVALNAPDRRPEVNFEEVCQYAQRRVDFLDLETNRLASGHFLDVISAGFDVPVRLFASTDNGSGCGTERPAGPSWVLTFDKLLASTDFVPDMREILQVLHGAYDYPVDVEFALNFIDDHDYRIHVVQCRPLPVKGMDTAAPLQLDIPEASRIVSASGVVIGHSRTISIDRIIHVFPESYARLALGERHEVARLLGRLNRTISVRQPENVLLMGPGRWGSSCPSLGIPVSFSEISRVAVLCEIVAMGENPAPDVSLCTHFINELIEMDMLYLALFPTKGGNYLNGNFFRESPNRLLEYAPGCERWTEAVKVISARDVSGGHGGGIFLAADSFRQMVGCYHGPRVVTFGQ